MRKFIAANWKMNGLLDDSIRLVTGISDYLEQNKILAADILICPPFPLISPIKPFCKANNLYLGSQDCHSELKGAHTGDTSPDLLSDLGCSHVILGHSERRANHSESNEIINKKVQNAINCQLIPIICIGETQDQRSSNQTQKVLKEQIIGSIPSSAALKDIIVAYEPVWAIGTGLTPSMEQICDAHAYICETLSSIGIKDTPILYGGSVKSSNSREILSLDGVDGALVGGASLILDDFLKIIKSSLVI